nr:IgGFc-binding protein [Flavobacterium sp.]
MRFFCLFVLLLANTVTAQLSKKHWLPPIHARDGQSTVLDHYVYLSTPETTPFNVIITSGNGTPINGSPFTISSGNPVRVLIGNSQPSVMFLNQNDVNIIKTNKGLILEADKEFYATFKVRAENHAEILIGKGYQGIGKAFRLGSLPQSYDGTIRNFFSSFMATEDNTLVELSDYDPNVEFVSPNGNITDDTQTFLLNKGESVTVSGYTNISANLSGFVGALLTSNKPIAVNTGNAFAGMTTSQDGQDFTFDQIVPFEEIGNEYVVIKGNGSDNVEMPLLIATENNTNIFINGNPVPLANINAGDYILIPTSMYQGSSNKNMHILSSKPIYVYQILGGSTYDATSGLNFIPPLSCYFQKEVDLIPSINTIGNTPYISDIIALTYTGSTLTINGNPITATPQLVAGNPQWSTYKIPGFSGNIKVESTGPLAVGMLGSSGAVGFAGYYSGFGSEPKDSNIAVCSDRNTDLFNLIEGNPDPGGTWTPPLASGTGVFNPNLDAPGQYVYNFTGLCEIVNVTVTVSVQQALNPGTSTQTEICKNAAPIDLFTLLGPNAQTGGTWSPALSSGGNMFNPVVDPSGVYTYSIISNDVCESVSATITVTVNPLPITNLISDFTACDNATDGDDTNGEVFFNLLTKTSEILGTQTGITVTYHILQADADNGTNAITGIQSGNRIIYVRLKNNLTGCYTTTSFNLIVNALPVVPAVVTLKQCDDDQDAITNFNLTEANLLITSDTSLT